MRSGLAVVSPSLSDKTTNKQLWSEHSWYRTRFLSPLAFRLAFSSSNLRDFSFVAPLCACCPRSIHDDYTRLLAVATYFWQL
jgi:hypothetical protein